MWFISHLHVNKLNKKYISFQGPEGPWIFPDQNLENYISSKKLEDHRKRNFKSLTKKIICKNFILYYNIFNSTFKKQF